MARAIILSVNNETVYPATILDAIIDPTTGQPVSLGGNDVYTINNLSADANGNSTITYQTVQAAPRIHSHAISDVTDLQTELNGKSDTNHTHTMVTSITVGGASVTGNARIVGTGNVKTSQISNNINITITPYTTDLTRTVVDANSDSKAFRIFIGTETEWNTFKETIANDTRYIVFIRS